MSEFVAVVRTIPYQSHRGSIPVRLTELELLYADGRDCGVPIYLNGYEEVSRLLGLAGVTAEELSHNQADYDKGIAIRIAFCTDEEVVKGMGFDPRKKGEGGSYSQVSG